MSLDPTTQNLAKYDFNNDGAISNADVDALASHNTKLPSSASDLTALHKAGYSVSGDDLVEFKTKGGDVTADDISEFLDAGGVTSTDNLQALQGLGVQITPEQLAVIETKMNTTRNEAIGRGMG